MRPVGIMGQRLAAIFLLGCALCNYPSLFLFNKTGGMFAIPLLIPCSFGAWAFVIGSMAYVTERMGD